MNNFKKIKKKITIYAYMFLLLAFSGNPLFFIREGLSQYVFIFVVLLLAIRHHAYFNLLKASIFYKFIFFFIAIFISQKLVLGFISIPGAISFLLKITMGYIVIRYLGLNFKFAYFNVIYFISLISLIGFLWNYLGYDIPAIYSKEQTDLYVNNSSRNIILFNQLADGNRNSGMFWEPGAFGCFINLTFLFYLGNLRMLLEKHKYKVVIILLALITTFSTTGYLVFFLIAMATIYFEYSRKYGLLVLPISIVFGFIAFMTYQKSEFLKKKIDEQFEVAVKRNEGEFAPDRLSALLFDLHYIEKHPLIGNGLHSETRYADHPWLKGKELGHGNGFSNFIASMGFLSLFFYSFYILKYNENHSWVFIIGFLIMLQGEHLLNYPLFLTIPFIFVYEQ